MNLKTTDLSDRRLWCIAMSETESMEFHVEVLAFVLKALAAGVNPPEILTKMGQLLAATHQSIGPSPFKNDLDETTQYMSRSAKNILSLIEQAAKAKQDGGLK